MTAPEKRHNGPKRILLVEDNEMNAFYLMHILRSAGYEVVQSGDGNDALDKVRAEPFDGVVTDWLMPGLDGMELIRQIHEMDAAVRPITMMVTVMDSLSARQHALSVVGADEFMTKPVEPRTFLQRLESCLLRHAQSETVIPAPATAAPKASAPTEDSRPPYVAVCLIASTGGIIALEQVLADLESIRSKAAIFIVQHGAPWMLETFRDMLMPRTRYMVHLAEDGMHPQSGHLYIAPGEHHMLMLPQTFNIRLTQDPPENYVRPSADPLLRSVARSFGACAVTAVLTGLGRDGGLGAVAVRDHGGTVLVQSPDTCTSPHMVKNIIQLGAATQVVPLQALGEQICATVRQQAATLIGV